MRRSKIIFFSLFVVVFIASGAFLAEAGPVTKVRVSFYKSSITDDVMVDVVETGAATYRTASVTGGRSPRFSHEVKHFPGTPSEGATVTYFSGYKYKTSTKNNDSGSRFTFTIYSGGVKGEGSYTVP